MEHSHSDPHFSPVSSEFKVPVVVCLVLLVDQDKNTIHKHSTLALLLSCLCFLGGSKKGSKLFSGASGGVKNLKKIVKYPTLNIDMIESAYLSVRAFSGGFRLELHIVQRGVSAL